MPKMTPLLDEGGGGADPSVGGHVMYWRGPIRVERGLS